MNSKIKVIVTLILLFASIFLLGIISIIIRIISIESIILFMVVIALLSNKKGIKLIKKLIRISQYNIKKTQSNYSLPMSRKDAAKQSLKSIEQLTSLIQNNITSEALKIEKNRVEKEFLRGDLLVVIFGTGSSGKTSLIRALLKKIVGEVGASMGSTKRPTSYKLHLKNLTRGIKIIDTPGILEGGEEGFLKEKDSLLSASRADLIIFVLDCDLRSYEMNLIVHLTNIGKKILVVLNKCDLRGEEEEERLVSILKMRCRGLVMSEDIIPIAASPQSIPIIGSHPIQPNPKINQLIQRMAYILHKEGEELIADNILLQCKNLGESGKKLLNKQRLMESKSCVEKYIWVSSGVVMITPLPGIDLLGTAVVNGKMVMDISKIFGVQLTTGRSKELARSVAQTLTGLGIIKGGVSLLSNSLSLHLPTYIIGKTLQSITAAWLTKVAGESFITYFQQDQSWGDGGIQEVVQHHYNVNKRETNLKKFIQAAMTKVIRPLDRSKKRQLPPSQKPQEEGEAWGHEHQE